MALAISDTPGMLVASVMLVVVLATNLFELVFDVDGRARRHDELYRRFKTLQEQIARSEIEGESSLSEWDGDTEAIRRDEPPTFWALYAVSWNQTTARLLPEGSRHLRKVSFLQYLLKDFVPFQPQSFPSIKA